MTSVTFPFHSTTNEPKEVSLQNPNILVKDEPSDPTSD